MTVKELIEELGKYPSDEMVLVKPERALPFRLLTKCESIEYVVINEVEQTERKVMQIILSTNLPYNDFH